jgi:hypothetical protein
LLHCVPGGHHGTWLAWFSLLSTGVGPGLPLVIVVLAVIAGWFALGALFLAVLVGRGVRFELLGVALPRISSLTIPQRDEFLKTVRARTARESSILN